MVLLEISKIWWIWHWAPCSGCFCCNRVGPEGPRGAPTSAILLPNDSVTFGHLLPSVQAVSFAVTSQIACTAKPFGHAKSYFLCILGKRSEGSLFVIICFCLQILAGFFLTTINRCPLLPFCFFPKWYHGNKAHWSEFYQTIHTQHGWVKAEATLQYHPQAHINGAHKAHPVVSSGLIVKWFPDLKPLSGIF